MASKHASSDQNILKSLEYAKKLGTAICGIVGRDGGYTKKKGDAVIIIPTMDKKFITPYAESFQSVIWCLIISNTNGLNVK